MASVTIGKNYTGASTYKFATISQGSSSQAMDSAAYGTNPYCTYDRIYCHNNAATQLECALARFSVSTYLPSGAIVDDATAYFRSKLTTGSPVISLRQLKHNWGITDTSGGSWEAPATHGQATWRRSFDFNGTGGDQVWTGGSNFVLGNDASGITSQVTVTAANTFYGFPCTPVVKNWVNSGQPNYGFVLWEDTTSATTDTYFWADCTNASAPYLTINYHYTNEMLNMQDGLL